MSNLKFTDTTNSTAPPNSTAFDANPSSVSSTSSSSSGNRAELVNRLSYDGGSNSQSSLLPVLSPTINPLNSDLNKVQLANLSTINNNNNNSNNKATFTAHHSITLLNNNSFDFSSQQKIGLNIQNKATSPPSTPSATVNNNNNNNKNESITSLGSSTNSNAILQYYLIAYGQIKPKTEDLINYKFISRHDVDGKFIYVEPR